jgi:predicted nicotinamide N-methyase
MVMTPQDATAFVLANTLPLMAPLVPELILRLATEVVPLWQMTEADLALTGLPPPYWAFAWAGGQALARYTLDHPETVAGKRVLDFGAGSGLGAVAAAKAGAARVLASDIDLLARAAIALNADANGVRVEVTAEDVIGRQAPGEVILIGDMCYEQPLAGRIEAWLRQEVRAGRTVLLGDPGRTYFPKTGHEKLASYQVKTTRDLEDTDVRNTGVYRLLAD